MSEPSPALLLAIEEWREQGRAEVRARVEAVLRQWHLDARLNSHPLAAEVRAALKGDE